MSKMGGKSDIEVDKIIKEAGVDDDGNIEYKPITNQKDDWNHIIR